MHLQELVYKHICKNNTKATIVFQLDNPETGTYHFVKCDFKPGTGSNDLYTIEDWEDLSELNTVIKEKVEILKSPYLKIK